MKFAIDFGHNAPIDTGAKGIQREDFLIREVGKRLIYILKNAGHIVVETAPEFCTTIINSLQNRVEIANTEQVDLFVSLHFNAANFNAHGSEIYALSRAGGAIARSVLDEIVTLGFHDRGVKRANFYVLRHTTMPAILIECCFCDSPYDMRIFEAEKMAKAIARGLIGELEPNINELRTLRITRSTWFKSSTDQAKDLPDRDKSWMEAGKYQVLAALPEEEGHFWIRLQNGKEGFVFAGHGELS